MGFSLKKGIKEDQTTNVFGNFDSALGNRAVLLKDKSKYVYFVMCTVGWDLVVFKG